MVVLQSHWSEWTCTLTPNHSLLMTMHTLLVVGQKVLELCVHLLVNGARSECLHPHIGAGDGGTHNACMETRVLPGNKRYHMVALPQKGQPPVCNVSQTNAVPMATTIDRFCK